jgi:hypothetical protein
LFARAHESVVSRLEELWVLRQLAARVTGHPAQGCLVRHPQEDVRTFDVFAVHIQQDLVPARLEERSMGDNCVSLRVEPALNVRSRCERPAAPQLMKVDLTLHEGNVIKIDHRSAHTSFRQLSSEKVRHCALPCTYRSCDNDQELHDRMLRTMAPGAISLLLRRTSSVPFPPSRNRRCVALRGSAPAVITSRTPLGLTPRPTRRASRRRAGP